MPPSCRSSCDLSPSLPRPTPSRPLVHWIVIVANHQSGRLAVAETDDSEGERGSGRGVSQSEPLRPLSLFADNEQVSGKKPSPPPSFLPSSLFLYPFLLSCHSSVNKRGGLENQLARTRATYGKQGKVEGGKKGIMRISRRRGCGRAAARMNASHVSEASLRNLRFDG